MNTDFFTPSDYEILFRAAEEGAVLGAYLFAGASRPRQREAARAFLSSLLVSDSSPVSAADSSEALFDPAFAAVSEELVNRRISLGTHLDVQELDSDAPRIGIDEIRSMSTFLMNKPLESRHKAAVLYDASRMTEAAQNAILKTLEEPPSDTVIVLADQSQGNFLPTILSRVQTIRISEDGEDEMQADVDFLLSRLEGILMTGDTPLIFKTADALSKQASINLPNYLRALHGIFISLLPGSRMRIPERFAGLANAISAPGAVRMAAIVKEALAHITSNVSPQLALEVMLIRLQEEYNAENSGNPI